MRSSQKQLDKGRNAMAGMRGEAKAAEKRSEGKAGSRSVDVGGVLAAHFAHHFPVVIEAVTEPPAASVHGETAAAAWGGIGSHKVVARTDFHSLDGLRPGFGRAQPEPCETGGQQDCGSE